MDLLGRDAELCSLHAFLDRPAAGGMTALILEGEAGIGKSTLWLAGVEAARERGLRVLSSRPAELESGIAHAGLGDLFEDALGDVLDDLAAPRRHALETALLVGDAPDEPVDFRTLAVAVRSALSLLAEREQILVAIDDVQWLDASSTSALAFALRRSQDKSIRLFCARRVGEGIPVSETRGCCRRQAGTTARRPAQCGCAARDPATAARPGLRTADTAAPPRSLWWQPALRARPRRRTRHGRRSDAAAPGPRNARDAVAGAARELAG